MNGTDHALHVEALVPVSRTNTTNSTVFMQLTLGYWYPLVGEACLPAA